MTNPARSLRLSPRLSVALALILALAAAAVPAGPGTPPTTISATAQQSGAVPRLPATANTSSDNGASIRPTTSPSRHSTTRPRAAIRIAVAGSRSTTAEAKGRWQPFADYLTAEVPGLPFVVVGMRTQELAEQVANGEVDFFIAAPEQYADLQTRFGCRRLATGKFRHVGSFTAYNAAAVIARADRVDLNAFQDLRNQSCMTVNERSFVPWLITLREFKAAGIEPRRDFKSLKFTNDSNELVVYAVQDYQVDFGVVRADALERLAAVNRIDLADFKVINLQQRSGEFPFLRSTPLYPELTFCVAAHVSEDLYKRVLVAMLEMRADDPAAKAGHLSGWSVAANFVSVFDCLRELRLPPYENYNYGRLITIGEASTRLTNVWLGTVLVGLCVIIVLAYVLGLHRRQKRLAQRLENQLQETLKAESALQESEAFYHSLVSNVPQYIIRKDLDGRFTFANRQFCEQVGHALPQIIGKTDLDFFPRDLAIKYRADDQAVMHDGRLFETIEAHVAADGKQTFVHVIKVPVHDPSGKTIGIQGIFWDVTDRKRFEMELEQKNRLLEEAVRRETEARMALQTAQATMVQNEKLTALGQMVAGVAHEINNPLSFVSNNVAVLQRDVSSLRELLELYRQAGDAVAAHSPELAQRIQELGRRIDADYTMSNLAELMVRSREGLKRIQQIVRDLRDFARLDTGELHEADVNEGVQSTINIIRGAAKRKNVALDLQLTPLPPVTCSPAKINQVVLNLVANAIDACPEHGRVTVVTRAVTQGIEIAISDTGHGIEPAIRDRIFDPFFTTKRPGEGTGLGLSISYGIVQDHNGTIRVDSEVGKGSTFTIFLPARAHPGAAARPQTATPSPPPSPGATIEAAADETSAAALTGNGDLTAKPATQA